MIKARIQYYQGFADLFGIIIVMPHFTGIYRAEPIYLRGKWGYGMGGGLSLLVEQMQKSPFALQKIAKTKKHLFSI